MQGFSFDFMMASKIQQEILAGMKQKREEASYRSALMGDGNRSGSGRTTDERAPSRHEVFSSAKPREKDERKARERASHREISRDRRRDRDRSKEFPAYDRDRSRKKMSDGKDQSPKRVRKPESKVKNVDAKNDRGDRERRTSGEGVRNLVPSHGRQQTKEDSKSGGKAMKIKKDEEMEYLNSLAGTNKGKNVASREAGASIPAGGGKIPILPAGRPTKKLSDADTSKIQDLVRKEKSKYGHHRSNLKVATMKPGDFTILKKMLLDRVETLTGVADRFMEIVQLVKTDIQRLDAPSFHNSEECEEWVRGEIMNEKSRKCGVAFCSF